MDSGERKNCGVGENFRRIRQPVQTAAGTARENTP
jgi:hypothetical protein